MAYSKEDVKNNIDLDDVYSLLDNFGAEPRMYSDHIEAITICHCGQSKKLYYYDNSQMFNCFTECGAFDIIELVQKVKGINDFNAAIYFLVNFFNLQWKLNETDETIYSLEDWKIFDRRCRIEEIQEKEDKYQKIHLPECDSKVLTYYPQVVVKPWLEEHIDPEVIKAMGIKYDPLIGAILIPHYDEDNRLIGIRQRTLVEENEIYGKYRPWINNGNQYNHPLAFSCFGLNWAKENIRKAKIAIVVESEKSVYQYVSYFGFAADIVVAVCGSSLSKYQFESLLRTGAEEIVIAFDKDYENIYTEEYKEFTKKMKKINDKFGSKCTLSFIVDDKNLLGMKCSPTDRGKEIFLELFKDRRFMK